MIKSFIFETSLQVIRIKLSDWFSLWETERAQNINEPSLFILITHYAAVFTATCVYTRASVGTRKENRHYTPHTRTIHGIPDPDAFYNCNTWGRPNLCSRNKRFCKSSLAWTWIFLRENYSSAPLPKPKITWQLSVNSEKLW